MECKTRSTRSSGEILGNLAQELLARAGLPDNKDRKRGLVGMCLLAAPETVAFDYEEYREEPSEDRCFTETLGPGRLKAILAGDTLTLEEMRRWHAAQLYQLLEWWSIGIGSLYEIRNQYGATVYALHLVSGGGYEYREWFFGPWSTRELAREAIRKRGEFVGWFPGDAIPYDPEKIMAWESEAGFWAGHDPQPLRQDPVLLFPVLVDGKTGFINTAGHFVIPPRFSGWGYEMWTSAFGPIGFFDEGLAPVWVGNRTGFIDAAGWVAIAPKFARTTAFSDGLAAVQVGEIETDEHLRQTPSGYQLEQWNTVPSPSGHWGYINRKGDVAIPFRFDFARPFREGLGLVEDGGVWGYVDRFGNPFLRPKWDNARPFFHGLAAVKKDGRWGVIGRDGRYRVKPDYDEIKDFSSDLAPACKDGKWGFVEPGGTMPIVAKFDSATGFSEGLAAVNCGGPTGFIDRKGSFVILPKLDAAESFSEGLAPARAGLTWGYISASGDWKIEPQFDRVLKFRQGLAAVSQRGRWGYITPTGDFVWPLSA